MAQSPNAVLWEFCREIVQSAQAAFWGRLQDVGSGPCGNAHESGRMTNVAPGPVWRGKVTLATRYFSGPRSLHDQRPPPCPISTGLFSGQLMKFPMALDWSG